MLHSYTGVMLSSSSSCSWSEERSTIVYMWWL